MRRVSAILLCVVMMLSMTACARNNDSALSKDEVLQGFEQIYGIEMTYVNDTDADDTIALTVNEGNRCLIDGKEAGYQVVTDGTGYLSIDANGTNYSLSVLSYTDASLTTPGSYALNVTPDESITPILYVKNLADPEVETVEITIDNWAEYLEVVPCIERTMNVFDEIEDIHLSHTVRLNETYADSAVVEDAAAWLNGECQPGDIAEADIAIEVVLGGLSAKTITYDIASGDYTLADYTLKKGSAFVSDKYVTTQVALDKYDIVRNSENSPAIEGGWNDYYDMTYQNDGTTITRTEEIYEKYKVKRIQGTISFVK